MVMAREYRRKAVCGLRKSHILVSDVKSKELCGGIQVEGYKISLTCSLGELKRGSSQK